MRQLVAILNVLNLLGLVVALAAGELLHGLAHLALVPPLGLWAKRVRERSAGLAWGSGSRSSARQEQIDVLESEVSDLRRELNEAQERLDFTERLMAQRANEQRAGTAGRQAT